MIELHGVVVSVIEDRLGLIQIGIRLDSIPPEPKLQTNISSKVPEEIAGAIQPVMQMMVMAQQEHGHSHNESYIVMTREEYLEEQYYVGQPVTLRLSGKA